jgi:hypothetical protein
MDINDNAFDDANNDNTVNNSDGCAGWGICFLHS